MAQHHLTAAVGQDWRVDLGHQVADDDVGSGERLAVGLIPLQQEARLLGVGIVRPAEPRLDQSDPLDRAKNTACVPTG